MTVSSLPVSTAPNKFHPLTPCRVVDTRNPAGPTGGPALAASATRTFPLAGKCGVPSGAIAVSANVTVTAAAAAGLLRVYPGNIPMPPTSTVNFRAGQTRAVGMILTLATDGTGTVAAKNETAGSAHFIVDVNGYFQ